MRSSSDQRTLAGVAATLRWQPLDGDGFSAALSGAVTVVVSSSDGTTLATLTAAGPSSGRGAWAALLLAEHTVQVDRLTCVWRVDGTAQATTHVEIVGRFFAGSSAVSARMPNATDESEFSRASFLAARDQAESEIEVACGYAFVPRFSVERITVRATCRRLVIPGYRHLRAVRWGTVDTFGTIEMLSAGTLASIRPDNAAIAERTDGGYWLCGSQVTIGFEHGMDEPPAEVVDAFHLLLQARLAGQQTTISPAATSFTSPDGVTTQFASPGSQVWHTGIREVDRVINTWRAVEVGIA